MASGTVQCCRTIGAAKDARGHRSAYARNVAIAGVEKLDQEVATHGVMTEATEFDLERFVQAQEPLFERVLEELRSGQKRSHWMWFVFPQLKNLGHSSMAQFYGIASLEEARAYLGHRLLGNRLVICTETLLTHTDMPLNRILGSPDDLKFCSSMTLFSLASSDAVVFKRALDQFCDGRMDKRSLAILGF
jgi:uncharacterized protein (DUF1810 family)